MWTFYVFREGMHPPFQMPTFENAYKMFKFPIIKHFEKIIADKGYDVQNFWTKIDDAVVKIILNSESYVTKIVSFLILLLTISLLG